LIPLDNASSVDRTLSEIMNLSCRSETSSGLFSTQTTENCGSVAVSVSGGEDATVEAPGPEVLG
jgi:hypothetical protein